MNLTRECRFALQKNPALQNDCKYLNKTEAKIAQCHSVLAAQSLV